MAHLTRIAPLSFVTLALLGASGTSPAASASPPAPSAWATVNTCDTATAPNSVGMRVGVRGDGRRRAAYARFSAQWWSPTRKAWVPVAGRSASPWLRVGSTVFVSSQHGWTFSFRPADRSESYIVRGLVELQWRAAGRVVRSGTLVTRGGLQGVDQGDPGGTSRASCTFG